MVMREHTAKEPRTRKVRQATKSGEPALPETEPVHSQPVSPADDLQVRIAKRAYEIYLERGSRPGYALSDWLEAEREILGPECNA
jgi:hypothetical protein